MFFKICLMSLFVSAGLIEGACGGGLKRASYASVSDETSKLLYIVGALEATIGVSCDTTVGEIKDLIEAELNGPYRHRQVFLGTRCDSDGCSRELGDDLKYTDFSPWLAEGKVFLREIVGRCALRRTNSI